MSSAVIFQTQSFIILLMIFLGVIFRKNRSLHVKIQMSAIIWDILLILQIELTRGAIDKASRALINPMLLNIHITIAVLCVVLYGMVFYTGRKILKGDNSPRKKHKLFGGLILILRTAVFVTSFWAVSPDTSAKNNEKIEWHKKFIKKHIVKLSLEDGKLCVNTKANPEMPNCVQKGKIFFRYTDGHHASNLYYFKEALSSNVVVVEANYKFDGRSFGGKVTETKVNLNLALFE